MVDRPVVLVPLAGGPPRRTAATGTAVRNEEEAPYGGDFGGCADEIYGGVAINLVGLANLSVRNPPKFKYADVRLRDRLCHRHLVKHIVS